MTNVVEFPKTNKVIYSDDNGNEIRYGEVIQVLEGIQKGLMFIAEEVSEGKIYGCMYEDGKYKYALDIVDNCTVVGEAALMPVNPDELYNND